jgi:ribonuclease BN (tRNA processing enzyme)
MRLTVLGGCGAWPAAGLACSGYLVEHDGFRLLIDPGYATFPRLLEVMDAAQVDAVLVSHGHPDHCAEATYPWQVPGGGARYLSSARQAGSVARQASAGRLLLTHLWPGTEPDEAVRAAAESYPGEIAVASPGLIAEPGPLGQTGRLGEYPHGGSAVAGLAG